MLHINYAGGILLAALVAQFSQGCPALAEGTEGSKYIREDPKNKAVVVFVHGWRENGVSAWTNEQTGYYWPNLLRTDPAFSDTNIYVFEYPAPSRATGLTVSEIGEAMYARLQDDHIFKYKQIIFIAHSLGGLTVRQMLLNRRDVVPRVPLLFFLGTPTQGSDLARIGQLISPSSAVADMLPLVTDRESYVATAMIAWGAANFPLRTVCTYEKIETKGVIVVPERSATFLCNEFKAIYENHSNMVKPKDTKADAYIFFRNAARRYINNTTGVETVDVKRVVDASNVGCDVNGTKKDEVNIDDVLHFVDGPPDQYLARAEANPGQNVTILDVAADTEPPPLKNVSGKLTYYKVNVSVTNDISRVRYVWKNAHSDDDLEVWSRPSALLRNFDVVIKVPPGVNVHPKSILPPNLNCQWTDNNLHVSCENVLTRDDPMIVTWSWDAWKKCRASSKMRAKK
jgi:triacylglycerol esterase/lipase EstA (alpha/beta hydrolase family)